MSLRTGGRRLAYRALNIFEVSILDIPAFLCPGLIRTSRNQVSHDYPQRRKLHVAREEASLLQPDLSNDLTHIKTLQVAASTNRLPPQCSGCGALSQTIEKDEPGYFDLKRKSVKQYLAGTHSANKSAEDTIFEQAIQRAKEHGPQFANKLGFSILPRRQNLVKSIEAPLCERCHTLKHHEIGVSIHHPSIHSIEDTIFESPYKYNHVYHIIDAADFPMSLIPGIHKLLDLTPQRSLNRRSKTGRFYHGKKTEVSFIITRSDLLAPKKEQVDSMMPYLRSVLRDALGRAGTDVRLGNIKCVSAKQGWWTKELKENIWNRGGGGWMVGKVNVGKSQLFREVFPKGRRGRIEYGKPMVSSATPDEDSIVDVKPISIDSSVPASFDTYNTVQQPGSAVRIESDTGKEVADSSTIEDVGIENPSASISKTSSEMSVDSLAKKVLTQHSPTASQLDDEYLNDETLDTYSLLPPAQIETDYPTMPLVSALPGTTASPIRVPFGNGKGELIDLPGLSRGDLELHIQPEHRSSVVMRSRIRPEQQVIKPGQSLLLGGFIRITPTTPDVIFLAYSFNPLSPHLTSTEKAIGTQTQTRESTVENISLPGTGEKVTSAGTFHLKWDVTRQRTGPITAPDAAGIKVDRLPFRVMSADILIEGCGWVELTAQVRKRPGEVHDRTYPNDNDREYDGKEEIDPQWPTVDVFSPEGKFIAARRPLNAWLNFAQKPSEKKAGSRPRRSMKGTKKLEKQRMKGKTSINK